MPPVASTPLALDTSNKNNLPSTPRLEYTLSAPDVQLIRDLLGGTRVMQAKFKTYIPKYKSEPADRYKIRATSAMVYGGLGRSLSASVGMLFAKPPQPQDAWPQEVTDQWENIDAKGTHGDVFAKRRAHDSLADGFVGILVDFPPAPKDVVVHGGNEQALNLRPKWAAYMRGDILSWITEPINNVETLTQVVLREGKGKRDGAFGILPVIQYRVCRLGVVKADGADAAFGASWELLEEVKKDGNITVVRVDSGTYRDKAGELFPEIPLAICYAGRTDATLTADPPLLDLAFANLEYWQIATELRWYEKLAAHPQPTVEGELVGTGGVSADGQVLKPTLTLGPTTMVNVEKGGKFGYTEVSGRSFDGLRASLDAKKEEMADLGATFLKKQVRGVESAEAKRLDSVAQNSTLATAAQGIEDGLNQALGFHARYLGIDVNNAPTLNINTDFDAMLMEAPVMQAYAQLVAQGYPKRLVLEAMQVGGRISEDEDLDTLEAEWDAAAQAAVDAKAAEAAANADAAKQNAQAT